MLKTVIILPLLRKVRIALAAVFWVGITLLLMDFTGALHRYLGWMAKVQLLPALLALNAGIVLALALLTLIFGRIYCSVICPLGVMQDIISHFGAGEKPSYKYRKPARWLRYGVLVLFVICLAAGVNVVASLLAPYSAYGRIATNLLQPVYIWGNNILASIAERAGSYAVYHKEVWLKSISSLIISIGTLAVIAALSLKGGRTYCNSICPVGTILSFFSRFAMFRPVIDSSKCKHCKACEHKCKAMCISITKEEQHIDYSRCVDCFNCIDSCKFGALEYRFAWRNEIPGQAGNDKGAGNVADEGRRAFMTGTAIAAGALVLKGAQAKAQTLKTVDGGFADVLPKQSPERTVPITPPGSKSVKDFYHRCTACQLCVAECPNNVLLPSSDLAHLMQPQMSFHKGFCRPECTICSQVCPAGAIRPIGKEEKTQYHVGTAHVSPEACISAIGQTHCGKCASVCPAGAIHMAKKADGNMVPTVNEQLCTGCGACEYYCPVRPVSAITVNGRYSHE